jgi:hypothetical protein
MSKRRQKVEIKNTSKLLRASQNLKCNCLVCKKPLNVICGANAEEIPAISGGVVFRSSGQFGSTILDCGVGVPAGWSNEIQITICDKCLLKNAEIINAMRNKRAVIERRPFADVAVNWSDYATYKEFLDAQKVNNEETADMFDKLMQNHESRKLKRARQVIRDFEKKKAKKK